MKTVLKSSLLLVLVVLLTAIPWRFGARHNPDPSFGETEIFFGELSKLDGQSIDPLQSRVMISVSALAGTTRPRGYRLYLGCEDYGMRLTPANEQPGAERRWTSFLGSSDASVRAVLRCPTDAPTHFNRLTEIMGAGGDVALEDRGFRLSSPRGSAFFAPSAHPID